MANSRKIGRTGVIWFMELHAEFEDNPSKVGEWEQGFIESIYSKVIDFGENMLVSEKQEEILKRIASKYGLNELEP